MQKNVASTMEKVAMTKEGLQELEDEFRRLKFEERPAIIKAIAAAREHGDLSENAEYHAAKEEDRVPGGNTGGPNSFVSQEKRTARAEADGNGIGSLLHSPLGRNSVHMSVSLGEGGA